MIPKYRQLAGWLRDEILSGTLEGGRLLPERELALLYKVSRQTVRQALAVLSDEGILEKKRGSGSYAVSGSGKGRGRIVFLLPGEGKYLPEPVMQEIGSVCETQRYGIQFYPTGGKTTKERTILQGLLEDPPEGICIAGTRTALPNPNLDLYRYLKNSGTAVVFAGSPYRGLENELFVSMDNMAGGHLAVRHLVSEGHTRIACLFGSTEIQDLERCGGCISAIRDHGLALAEDCYLWIPDQENCWFWLPAARQIAASCSAAICRGAGTARLLADALKTLGMNVPGDFELLYFQDDSGSQEEEVLFPSLVCAGQHPARVAVDCLLRMLAGKTVSPVRLNWRLEGPRQGSEGPGMRTPL